VNLKPFLIAALQSALDLGIAVPDDVVRHVTPDVLAAHLPRPLWTRLLTACLGAPRVDAQLIVETLGVPNLCEHVPSHILWACIEEVGVRSLGGGIVAQAAGTTSRPYPAPSSSSRPIPLATPPPPPVEPRASSAPASVGPSIPTPAVASAVVGGADLEVEGATRSRMPPGQRFRSSSTGIGRLAANNTRRPQAQATPPSPPATAEDKGDRGSAPRVKRAGTEADFDLETYVGNKDDWKSALAVEDEQLVDWAASDETVTNGNGSDELGRKR
jgi:hypothetical protein